MAYFSAFSAFGAKSGANVGGPSARSVASRYASLSSTHSACRNNCCILKASYAGV
jgi:hypothetical protein